MNTSSAKKKFLALVAFISSFYTVSCFLSDVKYVSVQGFRCSNKEEAIPFYFLLFKKVY